MLNPFREVNWQPDRAERRKFAVSLMVGFPIVATVLLVAGWWHGGAWNFSFPLAVGGVGAGLGAILWLIPRITWPFYVAWYAVACCLGLVVGNGVLIAVYLLMVTPMGWARRALGRRPFRQGFDRSAPSYWRDAPPPDPPEQYYRQF